MSEFVCPVCGKLLEVMNVPGGEDIIFCTVDSCAFRMTEEDYEDFLAEEGVAVIAKIARKPKDKKVLKTKVNYYE